MTTDTLAVAIAFLLFVTVFVVVGVLVGIIVAGRVDRLQAPRPRTAEDGGRSTSESRPPAAEPQQEDHQP